VTLNQITIRIAQNAIAFFQVNNVLIIILKLDAAGNINIAQFAKLHIKKPAKKIISATNHFAENALHIIHEEENATLRNIVPKRDCHATEYL